MHDNRNSRALVHRHIETHWSSLSHEVYHGILDVLKEHGQKSPYFCRINSFADKDECCHV